MRRWLKKPVENGVVLYVACSCISCGKKLRGVTQRWVQRTNIAYLQHVITEYSTLPRFATAKLDGVTWGTGHPQTTGARFFSVHRRSDTVLSRSIGSRPTGLECQRTGRFDSVLHQSRTVLARRK